MTRRRKFRNTKHEKFKTILKSIKSIPKGQRGEYHLKQILFLDTKETSTEISSKGWQDSTLAIPLNTMEATVFSPFFFFFPILNLKLDSLSNIYIIRFTERFPNRTNRR